MLKIQWADASGLKTLDRALSKLSGQQIRRIGSLALNRAGSSGRTHAGKSLRDQTGMPLKTIRSFMRVNRASVSNLEYRIKGRGGDISLKYFAARETRKGVSAKPFNQRRVFAGTFIKGGRFPGRVALGMNGQVFARVGSSRFPIEKQRSGVILPKEMVQGATAEAWQSTVGEVLPQRLMHEVRRVTGKAFS